MPKGRVDLYQFSTLRTGKADEDGSYNADDFETEIEHGYTDELPLAFSLTQNVFTGSMLENDDEDLTDSGDRFGGVAASAKIPF